MFRAGHSQSVRMGGMKFATEDTSQDDSPVVNVPPNISAESLAVPTPSLLVCFSGEIGSGKSSISRAVARRLGCGCASFGGYLREEVVRGGGDPARRESLQDLGQNQIKQDAELLCGRVLAAGGFVAGTDFVLDGVRHVEVLPHLVRIAAPSEVRLIFLKADVRLRLSRVGKRSDGAREDFDRAVGHIVEAELEHELPTVADAIVDGSPVEADVVEVCIGLITGWRNANSCVQSVPEVPGATRNGRPK